MALLATLKARNTILENKQYIKKPHAAHAGWGAPASVTHSPSWAVTPVLVTHPSLRQQLEMEIPSHQVTLLFGLSPP